MIADRAGALEELAVAPFEPLREADLAAHDLGRDLEAQVGRTRAFGRMRGAGQCKQEEQERGAWRGSTPAGRPSSP